MGFIAYLLTTFCAVKFIESMPWDGAQSTSLSSSPGWNPKPTPALLVGVVNPLLRSNDLKRRQARGSLCGYIGDQQSKRSWLLASQFETSPLA
jgi:hypothetical protein